VDALRAALVIARRVIRQRIRDRTALLFAVVTPLGLAVAFSALIPNDFSTFHTTLVVVDADGGHMATSLVDDALGALATAGVADIERVVDQAAAVARLEDQSAGAAVIIPSGFTSAIQSGAPVRVEVLGGRFPASVELARSAVTRFAEDVGSIRLAVATVAATGRPVDDALIAQAADLAQRPAIDATGSTTARRQAGISTFYGAAMAIMFVFFATQYGALALQAERQGGTLGRLLAAPIPPASIFLGGAVASLILGAVAMSVLAIGTTLLVHAQWGPAPLVALLILGAVIAAGGISLLIATFAHTAQQAGGLNAAVAMSLAALGGVFIPLSQAPAALATISQLTPHAWFLRGIDTLADPAAGLADILPSVIILVAMGSILGGIGLLRARRSLVST
jgi:linearmycin/streptolysin S transport system permease protein